MLHRFIRIQATPWALDPDRSTARSCSSRTSTPRRSTSGTTSRSCATTGVFDRIAGLLVGPIETVSGLDGRPQSLREVVLDVLGDRDIPVIGNVNSATPARTSRCPSASAPLSTPTPARSSSSRRRSADFTTVERSMSGEANSWHRSSQPRPREAGSPGRPSMAPSNPLTALGDSWAVRLTTFRRDGTPVSTPVNVAVDGDRVFFRTYEQAGKFKRLRNDDRVEVAPSTWRGDATGTASSARAQLLTGADDARAGRLIDEKHKVFQGFLVRTAHRLRRYTTRHLELLPLESSTDEAEPQAH